MADTVAVDPAVVAAAKAINDVIQKNAPAIAKVAGQHPDAGSFENAQTTERVTKDRVDAIAEHGKRLLTFGDTLQSAVGSFVDVATDLDRSNAGRLQNLVSQWVANVDTSVAQQAAVTEAKYHEFHDSSDDVTRNGPGTQTPEINAHDGDGWDDNLARAAKPPPPPPP